MHPRVTHLEEKLSEARSQLVATSSGERVFFVGGLKGCFFHCKTSDRVDIYNVTSGSWIIATLSLVLVLDLQPLPHKILSSLVEVGMEQHTMIKWIFTTH
jgi:hypothetical protein